MFVGIAVKRTYLCIGFSTGLYATSYVEEQLDNLPSLEGKVMKHLQAYSEKKSRKILAAGLTSDERIVRFYRARFTLTLQFTLCAKLWLHLDILPFQFSWKSSETSAEEQAYRNASKVEKHFNINSRNIETLVKEGSYFHCMPSLDYQYEVHVDFGKVHLVRLEDYRRTHCSTDLWNQTMTLAQHWRREKKRISFINATPQGGGVALMRHALIRLLRLLEVPCGWHVVRPSSRVFNITKRKFHNVLQGVAPPDCVLTEEDKAKYLRWSAKNAWFLEETIRKSAIIVIDDPQVVGLIPHIARINPSSHIEIRSDLVAIPNSAQAITWEFLWGFIQHCDLYIAHPVPRFVPATVSPTAVVLMPATTDPLDGLNKNLTLTDLEFYMRTFNLYLAGANQSPLDPRRPYVTQIGRFDPSKGLLDCMKAYRILCERFPPEQRPQLVLAGHGSVDDPDKELVLDMLQKLKRSPEFAALADDIKTIVLPAKDQILNAILREAKVAWQLSLREGFEVKVTEALLKGVPMIATKAGGIPLQINDGVTGFLVEIGDAQRVADLTYTLLTDEKFHHQMSQGASSTINEEFLTVSNACNWLWLGTQLQKGCISGVPELVRKWFMQHKDTCCNHLSLHYGPTIPVPLATPRGNTFASLAT